jgi:hypothetical protein
LAEREQSRDQPKILHDDTHNPYEPTIATRAESNASHKGKDYEERDGPDRGDLSPAKADMGPTIAAVTMPVSKGRQIAHDR